MKQTLTVTVIVLLQSGKNFLEDTLYSVQKQNYQPVEIIAIDSSAEGLVSESIAQYPELRYYHRPNQNKATNINFGILLARGEVIAFLDAGDMWANHKLDEQVNYLEAHPEVEIVQGLIQNVSRAARYLSFVECSYFTYEFINSGSLIYRRTVFEKVGMFDETLDAGEEIDWFLRAWEKDIVKIRLNQIALLHRQIHPKELSDLPILFPAQSFKVIKKHISRQKVGENIAIEDKQKLTHLGKYIGSPSEEVNIDFEPFTIIADDCWGYGPYNDFRMRYSTPFIDIRIEADCYLELLKDLQGYVESPLIFTNDSKYKHINNWRREGQLCFPIARLKNKVELLFVHEADQDTCREKWERRMKRINWSNLFIKFREDECFFRGEYLVEFDKFGYKNKVCFTLKEYPEFEWAICIPDYFRAIHEKGNIYNVTKKYFDGINWVKQTYGSNILAYKMS